MKNKKYAGVVVPMITPLTKSHLLDHDAVEKIFENFNTSGVAPFILGTTGESASLSLGMKKEYISKAGKIKKTGAVLYAGVSSNCLEESVELAKHCFDAGVDVVAATLPSYYVLSEQEMKTYFEHLADHAGGPVIIYNIPATTHMSLPLHIIDELSHHENIAGTKDSERSEERLKQSMKLWSGRENFSHFIGWAAKSAEALLGGSDGLIPSTGNLYPKLYKQLYEATKMNEIEKANELQKLSDIIGDLYQKGRSLGTSLSALKLLMKDAGICESYIMPPLQPLSAGEEINLINGWREIIKREKIQL
jgi:dihydrodipicolinate synthase/N-acetylneuraminate lyase